MLTPAQKVTLKTYIQANSDTNTLFVNGDLGGLADLLNTENTVPSAFWVWRPDVSRSDIYTKQNDLTVSGSQTGFWSWQTYKGQAIAEQNAWVQMFMGDQADFSASNLRDGIDKIFTGSAAATAQRDHCLAIGRRKATRAEKALAAGTGSTASPATMGFQGAVSFTDLVGL